MRYLLIESLLNDLHSDPSYYALPLVRVLIERFTLESFYYAFVQVLYRSKLCLFYIYVTIGVLSWPCHWLSCVGFLGAPGERKNQAGRERTWAEKDNIKPEPLVLFTWKVRSHKEIRCLLVYIRIFLAVLSCVTVLSMIEAFFYYVFLAIVFSPPCYCLHVAGLSWEMLDKRKNQARRERT